MLPWPQGTASSQAVPPGQKFAVQAGPVLAGATHPSLTKSKPLCRHLALHGMATAHFNSSIGLLAGYPASVSQLASRTTCCQV